MKNILQYKWTRRLALLLAGCLTSLSFAPYYYGFILPLTLSFLFYVINTATTKKQTFSNSFLFGFGLGSCSTYWVANALLTDGGHFAFLIPISFIGLGLLFGLFFAIPATIAVFYTAGWKRLLAWAGWFVVFEWVRSWFLTGFPWNLTGSAWEGFLPILQSASIFGVYGLSFITIITCSTLAFWPRKRPFILSMSVLLVLAVGGWWRLYNASDATEFGIKIRIVQPNIPATLRWDPDQAEESFSKTIRLSRQNNHEITHVIWPETAIPFALNADTVNRLRLMGAVRQGGTLILGGLRVTDFDKKTLANSLFVVDDLANITSYYDKSHLVPFGEYMPFKDWMPWDKIISGPANLDAGSGVKTINIPKAPPAGALICYEVIFSDQVVQDQKRPNWLINLTNDGWYGLSSGPYQHLGMSQMRAVEEGLPLIRSANSGISAVFDGYGRTLGQIPLGHAGVLDTALPRALPPTIYALYGVRLPLGLIGLVLLFLTWKRK